MGPAQPLWGLKDDREALPGPGPALGEGGVFYLFSQRLRVNPAPAISSHCVTLGKVISFSDFGFPLEKLSTIQRRFNPDGELESLSKILMPRPITD